MALTWPYAWLSIYAADFLIDARAADLVVPQDALNRANRWLRDSAAQSWQSDNIRSYGFYVLARQGAVNLSDLRYYHDTRLDEITTPLAAAHLGAALAEMGDRSRSRSAFAASVRLAGANLAPDAFSVYGSALRDVAGVTALVAGAGRNRVSSRPLHAPWRIADRYLGHDDPGKWRGRFWPPMRFKKSKGRYRLRSKVCLRRTPGHSSWQI